jgi:hypothetical protein
MRYAVLLLTFVLGAAVAFAQGTPAAAPAQGATDALAGKYEGTVNGSAERVSLELKSQGGKLSGQLRSGQNAFDVTEGTFKEGMLSLGFGKQAKFNGKVDGDKIAGELSIGSEKKSIELKRSAVAITAATPAGSAAAPITATPATPSAAFNLNGDWEAMADANGQPFPFLLTLKVEGETVTGNSSSQLGDATVKAGTWKDGRLSFQLEGSNGTITMSATVVDGKLSGDFDYAGQLQGKWVAVRKN